MARSARVWHPHCLELTGIEYGQVGVTDEGPKGHRQDPGSAEEVGIIEKANKPRVIQFCVVGL
jgi:hypothetical protein